MHGTPLSRWLVGLGVALLGMGCAPTVQLAPPSEPIVINMNIKIEHELRVRVEKDVEDLLSENEDLFGEGE